MAERSSGGTEVVIVIVGDDGIDLETPAVVPLGPCGTIHRDVVLPLLDRVSDVEE